MKGLEVQRLRFLGVQVEALEKGASVVLGSFGVEEGCPTYVSELGAVVV